MISINEINYENFLEYGMIYVTEKLLEKYGIKRCLGVMNGKERIDIVKIITLLIANRLYRPSSDLDVVEWINEEAYADIKVQPQHIYRTLDKLIKYKGTIEKSLFEDLTRFTRSSSEKEFLSTRIQDGRIIVNINGKALFGSGSASLNPSAAPVIDDLVDVLYEYPEYGINIKGHTDDLPISTEIFPSNWELSAIRATTVLKYLISRGLLPDRLTATGYGDAMPLLPNTSEENRAQNRRVEFVLEKKEARN